MLSSLMPGVRELRTPLSSGYLWLLNAWLLLGTPLPRQRPSGGIGLSVWTFGDYIGKPGVLAALSFAAYLLGSFIEINPQALWAQGGRAVWINRIREALRRVPGLRELRVVPVSGQAERDLAAFSRDELGVDGDAQDDSQRLMTQVMSEERQIATRLQAASTELFGRYDRLLAESSFRINVAPPLVLLVLQASLAGPIHGVWRALLPLAGAAYGAMFFRQGVLRAIQSRDVILQALIIGVVESRTIGRLRPAADGEREEESAGLRA